MTLIIALNCKNGIVMASDGQATVNSAGGPVRLPTQKIFPIGNQLLFGASGSVGTIQRSLFIMKQLLQQFEGNIDYSVMEGVRKELFKIYKNEIDRHKQFYEGTDLEDIRNAPIADVILCHSKGNNKIIWRIAPDCSDVLLHEIGYACTGSGDIFAYTLLKNFNVKDLEVEKGKLVAYRVIREAIEIGAFGLGEPIDIWIINSGGKITQLSKEEIMGLSDSFAAWKETEKEVFRDLVKK